MTGQDHQLAATQLSHHVYTLSCIISQQMTTIDRLVVFFNFTYWRNVGLVFGIML